jgi:hypothetical protein
MNHKDYENDYPVKLSQKIQTFPDANAFYICDPVLDKLIG